MSPESLTLKTQVNNHTLQSPSDSKNKVWYLWPLVLSTVMQKCARASSLQQTARRKAGAKMCFSSVTCASEQWRSPSTE